MPLAPLTIDGPWFREPGGRRLLLRGINLGGDCKVPYPGGGTQHPSDFTDHRTVSFVGRPFPLEEADDHFARLKACGFNVLRLLTTWEAVEHAGPGRHDEAYLDYFARIAARAGDFGLYVFIDFHQDVWSRMTGGDGAPGWLFEAVGLDFTRFHEAGAAHVMQWKYDYARGGRQEDRYPMMTWSDNYRLPANAIMWTLFFGGATFTPDFMIDGRNVQDYLQGHYVGALTAVAERVKHLPHVIGFDSLNEPGTGWIGQQLSYRHVERSEAHPEPVLPGPAWAPIDGLLVARGVTRVIPQLAFDVESLSVKIARQEIVNGGKTSIWKDGASCPFEAAGAYRLDGAREADLREDFFSHKDSRPLEHERDFMAPFFNRVAGAMRKVREDWLLFAELDPFRGFQGAGFPQGMPERTVNASHWYDVVTLRTKHFMVPSLDPFTGRVLPDEAAIGDHYARQLSRVKEASESLGGAPTLIGEFGIPFDLNGAGAYTAWAEGDRTPAPWESHVRALSLMYDVMDRLLLHTAQWNYTAGNRNDLATGDEWNQEDLSVYSADQRAGTNDPLDGTRAAEGFVRPYVRACQGTLIAMRFDRAAARFEAEFDADPAIDGPTEIFVPAVQFPSGFAVDSGDLQCRIDPTNTLVHLKAAKPGRYRIVVRRPGSRA
ncbi:MAG: cellulase family glycosylhydrolase [Alphaproteobacteria bacterium]|nr:cellulase family glycosylhydrolase [Alphaproteobacteria bacterium]